MRSTCFKYWGLTLDSCDSFVYCPFTIASRSRHTFADVRGSAEQCIYHQVDLSAVIGPSACSYNNAWANTTYLRITNSYFVSTRILNRIDPYRVLVTSRFLAIKHHSSIISLLSLNLLQDAGAAGMRIRSSRVLYNTDSGKRLPHIIVEVYVVKNRHGLFYRFEIYVSALP